MYKWVLFYICSGLIISYIFYKGYTKPPNPPHIYCTNHGGAVSVSVSNLRTIILCADSTIENED